MAARLGYFQPLIRGRVCFYVLIGAGDLLFELILRQGQLASGDPQTEIYSDYLSSYNPEYFKKYSENNMQGRIVVDYISGMTDRYALNLYDKLFVPQGWRQL